MTEYLAVTQQTCSWLLAHPAVLSALYQSIDNGDILALSKGEFAAGPLRLAGTPDGKLAAVWNKEYVSGTGHEAWGIIRLGGRFGLCTASGIGQQVFERQIYIFNQRLQGLIIDSDFIHRTWPNGSQTCLAGRGSEARQFSVSYFEGGPGFGNLSAKAVIAIGPAHDFDELQGAIGAEISNLSPFSLIADGIIDTRRRPLIEAPAFQALRDALSPSQQHEFQFDKVSINATFHQGSSTIASHETAFWTYEDWVSNGALNEAQRRVLESDVLTRHPVRVIGPAGSGKTLLMQLLAIRHLRKAAHAGDEVKIIYIVHNAAMAQTVIDRFRVLGAEDYLKNPNQSIRITTLSEYGRQVSGLTETMVIDKDAQQTKLFQLKQVRDSFRQVLEENREKMAGSVLMKQVAADEDLFSVFSALIVSEISNAIKGRGLTENEKGYVNAETPLSRLHGVLDTVERSIVFSTFKRYHAAVFEEFEMLDSDDIALTLAGRLRTPLWRLKRKTEGFDYIFVDEAQLFNENERRIFPYLANGKVAHTAIALALDEAQDLYAFSNAGLATLGIADVEDKNLPSNHRSTRDIVDLAFFFIQQTTDLFSNEFPDFKLIEEGMVSSAHQLASPPAIVMCNEDQPSFGRFAVKQVQKLRAGNVRQIAVVCHAETYWKEMVEAFTASGLPLHLMQQRGEKVAPDQPMVILSRPAFVGGQEFDAVFAVGLEQGVVPPRIIDNVALAAAVEQQVLREMYLVTTRARYRYVALLNKLAVPNNILQEAISENKLRRVAVGTA
jgi:superfamily I DNA/RNA helicase